MHGGVHPREVGVPHGPMVAWSIWAVAVVGGLAGGGCGGAGGRGGARGRWLSGAHTC